MEKRILNDKINFLRSIPVFSLLTKNSLAKITCSLTYRTLIKDQFVFKEGENTESAFIVINGEIQITKSLL